MRFSPSTAHTHTQTHTLFAVVPQYLQPEQLDGSPGGGKYEVPMGAINCESPNPLQQNLNFTDAVAARKEAKSTKFGTPPSDGSPSTPSSGKRTDSGKSTDSGKK